MGDMQFNGTPEEWDALVKKSRQTTMAQQTAVGWLTDQIKEHKKKFGIPPTEKGYMNLIEQAKQIEKEQIMNAANTLLYRGTGPSDMWAEQYYNETYNKM